MQRRAMTTVKMNNQLDRSTEVFVVTAELAGERLDKFISLVSDMSRTLAAKVIEDGNALVNGRVADKKLKLKLDDLVELTIPEPALDRAEPEDIPLDIVYEDDDIIVVNKPEGMIVHPAPGVYSGTLVNALLYHCKGSLSGIGGIARPGIVHRIDKDTSGLLVVAKNDFSHNALAAQIKVHAVSRIYVAIALGNIKEDSGTIDKPIGRHPVDRKKMAVILNPAIKSRDAITHYTVLERFSTPLGNLTLTECRLETGRTHQIRVHLASGGHPLLGDEVYGGVNNKIYTQSRSLINGQCLHARQLTLTHPRTGREMTFEADIPENMSALIEKLRRSST